MNHKLECHSSLGILVKYKNNKEGRIGPHTSESDSLFHGSELHFRGNTTSSDGTSFMNQDEIFDYVLMTSRKRRRPPEKDRKNSNASCFLQSENGGRNQTIPISIPTHDATSVAKKAGDIGQNPPTHQATETPSTSTNTAPPHSPQ